MIYFTSKMPKAQLNSFGRQEQSRRLLYVAILNGLMLCVLSVCNLVEKRIEGCISQILLFRDTSDESTRNIPSVTIPITALKDQLQQYQWSAAKSRAKNALPYLDLADNLRK